MGSSLLAENKAVNIADIRCCMSRPLWPLKRRLKPSSLHRTNIYSALTRSSCTLYKLTVDLKWTGNDRNHLTKGNTVYLCITMHFKRYCKLEEVRWFHNFPHVIIQMLGPYTEYTQKAA